MFVQTLRLRLHPLYQRYLRHTLHLLHLLWYLGHLRHPLLRRTDCVEVEPPRLQKLLTRVSRLQKCAVSRSEHLRLAHHLQTAGSDRACMWACLWWGGGGHWHHVLCGTRLLSQPREVHPLA